MDIIDKILDDSYKTLIILDNQKEKLNNIEKFSDNINVNLSTSEIIINKMRSIWFNIKSKFINYNQETNVYHENKSKNSQITNQDDNNIVNNIINNKIKKIKEVNLIIGDELDIHNEKLENINNKCSDINTKINILDTEISKIT